MNNYGEAVRRCAQKSIFCDFFTTEDWMYFVAELDPLFTSYKFCAILIVCIVTI